MKYVSNYKRIIGIWYNKDVSAHLTDLILDCPGFYLQTSFWVIYIKPLASVSYLKNGNNICTHVVSVKFI